MKQLIYLFALGIGFTFLGCESNAEEIKALESRDLATLFAEIETLASSENCINAANWTFTGYGSKACGNVVGYIAYPKSIDTDYFQELLQRYANAQRAYNEKWGIISDCSIPNVPLGVACQNGKPTLIY